MVYQTEFFTPYVIAFPIILCTWTPLSTASMISFLSCLCATILNFQISSVQFSHSHVRLFVTPWTAARQASLSITNSQSLSKLMFIVSVMLSNHLILSRPLLLLPSIFPRSGSFQMSQFLASGDQSIRASALVLPKNTQNWSPLGWTGWISLQCKGLSRVFSKTTVQKHQFFGTQLSSYYNSHIHTRLLD